jgi:hypothetical protein
MNNKNKSEQILLRLNTSLKEDVRKRAEQTNLSMSSYIIKKLEGDSLNTQLFSEIQRENRELKDQLQETFFYLKRDTEELKELITSKDKLKQFSYKKQENINKENIHNYNEEDILVIGTDTGVITSVSKEEGILLVYFISQNEIKKLNLSQHYTHIKEIIKKVEV